MKTFEEIVQEARGRNRVLNFCDKMIYEDTIRVISERDARLEYLLRTKVNPPIKGEITKGKIRWRGLRIIQSMPHTKQAENKFESIYYVAIEQRGVIIPFSEEEYQAYKKRNL